MTEKDKITLDPPIRIDTAAGKTTVDYSLEAYCEPLGQTVYPLVMADGTPNVISIRKRCTDEGYGFRWAPYSKSQQTWKPVHNCRDNSIHVHPRQGNNLRTFCHHRPRLS